MKYCPQCEEHFSDDFAFCDIDGSALVDDISSLRAALRSPSVTAAKVDDSVAQSTSVTALIGILVGIVICMLVYIAFLTPSLKPNDPRDDERSTSARPSAPAPLERIVAAPLPVPSPSIAESPSPEEEAEVASAEGNVTPVSEAGRSPVNQGPISTGATRISEGRTLIMMKDGSSVEADAAWEDAQGVWYRRSGLVSFVERSKVERLSDLTSRPATDAPKP